MALTTAKGYPYPEGTDPAENLDLYIQQLAEAVDASPGIKTYTTVQRDALAAPQKWAGRIIWNSDVGIHQRWTGAAWVAINLPTQHGAEATGPQLIGGGAAAIPANSNGTDLQWSAETFDSDGYRDPAFPDRLTVPAGLGGLYIVTVQLQFGAVGAAHRGVNLNKFPAPGFIADERHSGVDASSWHTVELVKLVQMAAGDYLTAQAVNGHSAAINLGTSFFGLALLGV